MKPEVFLGLPIRVQDAKINKSPYIKESAIKEKYRKIPINEIAEVVESVTQIPIKDMKKNVRFRQIVEARQMVMYFAYQYGHTVLKIGEFFEKDHSTVTHGKRTIEMLCTNDKKISKQVYQIKSILSNGLPPTYYRTTETNAI